MSVQNKYLYPQNSTSYLARKAEADTPQTMSENDVVSALVRLSCDPLKNSFIYSFLVEAFAHAAADHLYNLLEFVYAVLQRASVIRPAQKDAYAHIYNILNNRNND
jgi:hypothetical protein